MSAIQSDSNLDDILARKDVDLRSLADHINTVLREEQIQAILAKVCFIPLERAVNYAGPLKTAGYDSLSVFKHIPDPFEDMRPGDRARIKEIFPSSERKSEFQITEYDASLVSASELSLYMFQEIAASKDLNVSIIIRQVRDYTSYQAALGQLNIATLSREEFDKIEYERDKFLWHKSENKCIPNAMNFLRGKLNLPSSMEFIDVQTEYRFDALVPSCLDVFICSNQAQSFRERVVVGVEFFKTGTKIAKSESGQFLVELASIASHSEYPCLLLLTDLVDSYTIAYFSKPPCDNTQLYILYELRSTAAFDLIRKWLAMDSSNTSQYQDARASLKDHFFNETPAELIEQQRSNHYNLMSGYISQKIEKAFLQTGKQLISKGRSGGVFAVDVDNKQLALKICNFINTTVVEEMMNETRIYELLVKANYKYAPKLESYGTFQSKKYFGIAIQRVRGRAINNREEKVVKEECMKAIKALHELKICHNDVRPPNILVTESGQISVIDFGLSFRTHSLNYFNIDITRQ